MPQTHRYRYLQKMSLDSLHPTASPATTLLPTDFTGFLADLFGDIHGDDINTDKRGASDTESASLSSSVLDTKVASAEVSQPGNTSPKRKAKAESVPDTDSNDLGDLNKSREEGVEDRPSQLRNESGAPKPAARADKDAASQPIPSKTLASINRTAGSGYTIYGTSFRAVKQ